MKQISEVHNINCLEYMRTLPDKFFDLAIVDPPYGIGENGGNTSRHHSQKKYKIKSWDNEPPTEDYFIELFRVSKNQIIWGANHFIDRMPKSSSCWIFWDKDRYGDFADGELAYTSFKTAVRKFKFTWDGFRKQEKCDRIHHTEKPVALYKWLLQNYAKPGDKIFDSHMGSQSSRIAAWHMGFDYWGCELDKDYFTDGCKRFEREKMKQELFAPKQIQQPKQLSII